MSWQKLAAALAARRLVPLLVRIGLPAAAGAIAAILAELPPEVAQLLASKLCGS